MKPITLHLGKDRDFALSLSQVIELERLCGDGIGVIAKRVLTGDFHLHDLVETIRLGMIGGGASPREADVTVQMYCKDRPLSEYRPIAVAILNALYFGVAIEPSNDNGEGQSDAS